MKAIRIEKYGGREVLHYTDIPEPTPGKGQVLVKLEAAGVNFIDVYHRDGLYKLPTPFTLGTEGAGIVIETGPDVVDCQIGTRVAFQGVQGAYAEKIVVPADRLVAIPHSVSTHDAAALMLQGLTAHYLATSTYQLRVGDWCLIHAAAGGVGLLLCQVAKLHGAHIIGTTSTEQKASLARSAGADHIIRYTEQDFVTETKRLTDGRGVNVVYDSVGRTTFDQSLDCLAPRGMIVLFGQSSGPVSPFDPLRLSQKGSLYLTRPTLAYYVATRDELLRRTAELFDWLGSGKLSLRIDRKLPLAQAGEAHRALESRETTGKILLIP
jgi:NADPH2:quinone reductase